MVLAKKQLSKVVAIVLVAMCAVAFMPMLNGEAFAAAKVKTPAKVTVQSAKQVSGTYKVKVTWKKAKNAKKYNIKVGSKTYKNKSGTSFTTGALKAGTYKVKVQGVNGKKKGKWSKVKSVKVKDVAASVSITGEAVVGATLEAVVKNSKGKAFTSGVTYQWYRVNNFTGVVAEIAGATEATYTVTSADYWVEELGTGYQIYVVAKAGGKTVTSTKTDIIAAGYYAQLNNVADEAVTVPFAGLTVYANIYNAVTGSVYYPVGAEYQWYVDGVALKGKTSYDFTITNDEIGKTIECKISWNGKEYTTGVSAPVIESKMPTEVAIKGASGTKDDVAVPAVGDTLAAVFTAPKAAADPEATYQWYVGNLELKGETNATYTVQTADVGSKIRVEVTLSNGKKRSAVTDKVVANQLSNNDYTAVIVGTDGKEWKDLAIDATANQIVKPKVYANGDTTKADIMNSVAAANVEWYIDSVATENQLWTNNTSGTNPAKFVSRELHLTMNNAVWGTTADGTAATFQTLDKGLAGHTLIVVVPGNNTTYAGSVASSAVGPFGLKIAAPTISMNGTVRVQTGTWPPQWQNRLVAGVTTLEAAFADADTTATYQWYKSTDNGANYAAIAGATSANYVPTSEEAYDKVNRYKVVVTGTGSYMDTAQTASDQNLAFADSTSTVNVTISVVDEQGATVTGSVHPETVLAAQSSIASAEATMTYSWTFTDTSAGTTAAPVEGKTFTVPADAEAGDTVAVTATNSVSNYNITNSVSLTVRVDKIKSVTLTSTGNVESPVVGDRLTAAVDPANQSYYTLAWYYSDDLENAIQTGGTSYNLLPGDIGKTVVAVATGRGNYAGTSAEAMTGEVKAKVALVAYCGDTEITNDTQLKVGDKITVYAVAGDTNYTDVTSWTWKANGSQPAVANEYTIQNNDINGDNISVEAAGPFTTDSTLTWTYRGAIDPAE